MSIVPDRRSIPKPAPAAMLAREAADIHQATCRARRLGLVCSTCLELSGRAARLETASGWPK
jgi:hypothetical protein